MTKLAIAAIATMCSGAFAAPVGWSSHAEGSVTVHQPDGRADVELRVHAPESARDDVGAWFVARRRRAPTGVVLGKELAAEERNGVQIGVAMGARGTAPVFVVSLGCRAASAMVYAELITPQRSEELEAFAVAAAEIALQRCSANTAEPAAPTPKHTFSSSSIEALVYSWEQVYEVTGLQMYETMYLVLADGTVRKGLPEGGPDDFDVAADRRANSRKWGRWKKQGKQYLFDFGKGFAAPPGELLREPGKRDEKLEGFFEASSSATIGNAAAWSTRSITFDRSGRFARARYGGAGAEAVPGVDTTVHTTWNDEGSTSSVVGPNIGGGSTRSSNASKADRQGTYRIAGYTLELRYDSGRVERHFLALKPDRTGIWLGGEELVIRKKR